MSVLTHKDADCQLQMTKREASDLIFAYALTSWAEFEKILDNADIKPYELEHQTAQAHYRAYKNELYGSWCWYPGNCSSSCSNHQ